MSGKGPPEGHEPFLPPDDEELPRFGSLEEDTTPPRGRRRRFYEGYIPPAIPNNLSRRTVPRPASEGPPQKPPKWLLPVGSCLGVVLAIMFVYLLGTFIADWLFAGAKPIPMDSRLLAAIVSVINTLPALFMVHFMIGILAGFFGRQVYLWAERKWFR